MHPEFRYADWRPSRVRRWNARWVGIGVAIVVVGLLWAFLPKANGAAFMIAILISQFVSARLLNWQMRRHRDDPEGGQFAAQLRVSREVTYGYDEGLISFVDGWLVYTGLRCTFSLPASAVNVGLTDLSRIFFHFGPDDDLRGASLAVFPSKEFSKSALEWRMTEDLAANSVVLPPIVTEPSVLASMRPQAIVTALLFVVSLTVLLSGRFGFGGFITSTIGLVIATLLSVYASERRRVLRILQCPNPAPIAFWGRSIRLKRSPKSLPQETTLQ